MEKEKIKMLFAISERKINDLVPFDLNPRQMTDKQKEALTESLQSIGLTQVPLVDVNNMIVDGHQRVKILQLLGYGEQTIPVWLAKEKLTDQQIKEINIRMNLNRGEFDMDLLINNFEMEDLIKWGFTKDYFKIDDAPVEPVDDKVDQDPKFLNACCHDMLEDLQKEIVESFQKEGAEKRWDQITVQAILGMIAFKQSQ